jgi:predicted secreted acid phosphatase
MSVGSATALEEAAAGDPSAILAREPMENFDIARYRIADYADCVGQGGCYWADLDAQYKRAEAALDRQVATRKHGEKLALVMDIDETSVTSYCEMQRENYGYIPAMKSAWEITLDAAVAIPGALRLVQRAQAAKVDVFFITGRKENETEGTVKMLEAAGFHGWKGLYLKPSAEHDVVVGTFKASRRQRIVDQGYRLILNVGDQWSDLKGAPQAEVSVKLPNPFYFLP